MISRFSVVLALGCLIAAGAFAQNDTDDSQRAIEEVVVTAEKRESTVSDTSISITALDEDALEELGIQSPDELVNFIPATTRDPYDIRIRGVGRNFRAVIPVSRPTTTGSTPRILGSRSPRTGCTRCSG